MKMIISQLLTIAIIITTSACISSPPSWVRDPFIDAGQVKVVNIDVMPSSKVNASTTQNLTQNFNKTDFSSPPRVILGMIGYGVLPAGNLSSTQIGFILNITSRINTRFGYTVTFKGVTCVALHFTYFAVQGYETYFYLQNYYLTFNTSSPISNTTVVNRWQTTVLNNPGGMINYGTNYSSNSFIMQAWPISYLLTPKDLILAYNVTATPLNGTTFILNVSTSNSCSISQFGVSILSVNSTSLLERSYNQYMDFTYVDTVGNTNPYVPKYSTMTDYNSQYIFRNSLMGIYGCYFPIGSTPVSNYWYFNISTSNTSFLSAIAIQERMRSCGATTPYYMYQQMLCYDSCPTYYYTNTTYNYCIACYYSCRQCSYSQNYKACTSCESNSSRTLVNNSCTCQPYYFDNNTMICASCFYSCLTCLNQKNNSCLSCDSNAYRIFNNVTSTCNCLSNYYENTTCYPCINNCTSCTYVSSNSTVICLQCNTSLNQVVNLNQTGCQCLTGYGLVNSSCIVVNPICGNGILESGESCDDDNTANGDGCSSICQIEEGCTCTYNVSIYPYSLCYFSSSVTLSTISVYKYPLQNKFKLLLDVSAPNCNQDFLRNYLENHFSIQFASRSRLLIETGITSQDIKYDPSTTTLTVDATYNQDIDLTTKIIKFSPSLAVTSTSTRYFFQSPITFTELQKPSNLLLTTYLSNEQIETQKKMAFAYLGLIIFVWVFILVGVCYSQTAIAIEAMLIIQLSYQSLLQSSFIYEGWIGLIAYGKYTYGFNINFIQGETNSDRLSIINLSSNLANTLNFTAGIIIIGVVILVGMFIYEMIKFHTNTQEEFSATQTKINGILQSSARHLSQQRQNQQFYQLKKKWALFILQVVFALMFLTFKIVIITLLNISATYLTNTLAISLTLLLCYSIIWYLYYRSYDLDFLRSLSFRKILRNKDQIDDQIVNKNDRKDKKDKKDHWSYKFGNIFTKYYYLILFVFFGIFGIVDGAISIGAVFYIVIISIIIAFIILLVVFGTYFRKINLIRVVVNFISMVTISILYLLQTLKINSTSQNLAIPIIGLVLLYTVVFINFAVVVRIQYKKHRKIKKKRYNNKIKNLQLERKQTQQPQISFHQQIELQIERDRQYNDLNFSREGIIKQQKDSQSHNQNQQDQFAETKKKLNFQQKRNQRTKKKELKRQSQQIDYIIKGGSNLQEQNYNRRQSEIQQHIIIENGANYNPIQQQGLKNETRSIKSPEVEIIDI